MTGAAWLDHVLATAAKSQSVRSPDKVDRVFTLAACVGALRNALEAGQEEVLPFCLSQQNGTTAVCAAFEQSSLAATEETLNRICSKSKLTHEQALQLAVALTYASSESWRSAGEAFLKTKLAHSKPSSSTPDIQLLLQQLLLPVKHAQGLQNAAAAAKLCPPTVVSSSSNSTPSPHLAALLRDVPAGPVDALLHSVPSIGHPAASMPPVLMGANKLAMAMQELGYSCTANEALFKALLSQVPPATLTPQAVAEVLGLMARTHHGLESDSAAFTAAFSWALQAARPTAAELNQSTWNIPVVVDVLKAAAPSLNWQQVAECLDHDSFMLPDAPGLRVLMMAYKRATTEPFPLRALLGRVWANSAGQLSFLMQAVAAPPDLFTFAHSSRRVGPLEGLHARSPLGGPNQAWACIDLLALLCQLSEAGHWPAMQSILEPGLKACPEVLLVTTACVQRKEAEVRWSPLEQFVWGTVAPPYFVGHQHTTALVRLLHDRAAAQLYAALADWYLQDTQGRLPRVLELCQDAGMLPALLEGGSPALTVELACLAARREHLHLEKWVKEKLAHDTTQGGGVFISGAIAALESRLGAQVEAEKRGTAVRSVVTAEMLAVFLRGMSAAGVQQEPGLALSMGRLYHVGLKAFPSPPQQQLLTEAAGGTPLPGSFPPEVEEEANQSFQRIYSENKPVAEAVEQLKAYRASSSTKQQKVFACMVHNLFDEYRFFQNYPDKELKITAALFGSLLHYHMISGITLSMALRYVAQALAAPSSSKLFSFGLGALQQCRGDLAAWPQFCAQVVQLPQVKAADAGLVQQLEAVVAKQGTSQAAAAAAVAGAPLASDGELASLSSQQQPVAAAGPDISGIKGMFDNQLVPSKTASFSGLRVNGSVGGDAAASSTQQQQRPQPPQQQQQQQPVKGATAANGPAGGRAGQAGAAGGTRGGKPEAAVIGSDEAAVADLLADSTAMLTAANIVNEKPAEKISLVTANNETLELAERMRSSGKAPNMDATDKVSFIMNNLSTTNVEVRARDLAALVLPHFVDWFANYLVVKRAAQEPNHHALYIQLLDCMSDRELVKVVLATSFYYSKALLQSERAMTQAYERTLIKQLGSWLGLLTFARNKPILAKDMDLKEMIKEAYVQGRMVAVLPFIEKVVVGCKDSKVFKATNPMIAGLLSMLAEIHGMPHLKLNHCFVIEMTFKTFSMTPSDVIPSNLLANLERPQFNNSDFSGLPTANIPGQGSAFSGQQPASTTGAFTAPTSLAAATAAATGAATAPGAAMPSPTPSSQQRPLGPSTPVDASKLPPAAAASPAAGTPAAAASPAPAAQPAVVGTPGAPSPAPGVQPPGVMPSPGAPGGPPGTPVPGAAAAPTSEFRPDKLHSYVQIHPNLVPYAERLALKRVLPIALDRAICEIITPVVERSVTIACMTTFELVTKDYAVDPDEGRLRAAAQAMVSSLAGSLALVTCKEPLRVSLSNQLRTMLSQQQVAMDFLEQALQLLVQDNLELGCTFIEKAATDKALRDVDKALAQQYEARVVARQRNLPFPERNPYQLVVPGRFPGALPDSLKPKPGNMGQQRVYEDFTRLPKAAAMAARAEGAAGAGQEGAEGGALADKPLPDHAVAQGHLVDAYLRWTGALDSVAASEQPNGADLQKLLAEMEKMVSGNEKAAHFVASKLATKVFNSNNKINAMLTADALRMCAAAAGPNGVKLVANEVTNAWANLQHDMKYNNNIAELLIRRQLLVLPEVDAVLAKALVMRVANAIEFGVTLAKACQQGLCGASDISNTMELLPKVTADMPANGQVLQLLVSARAASKARAAERAGLPDLAGIREKNDPPGLHQQVAALFEEFARRCMASPDDKLHTSFVQQLRSNGLLNLDDHTDRMLRILVELAVQHCLQNESAGPPRPDGTLAPGALSFLAVDPLVKLVVCLTIAHGGGEKFLGRMLSVTAALVRRDAEDRGLEFNARPYLRLLVGLATEVGGGESTVGTVPDTASMRLLRLIALTLLALQPTAVPGFAFAYLELLSHRSFMPRLLMAPQQGGWQLFEALLVGLLQFLEPGLRAAELTEPLRLLYKGTLRLLLVLLHDFPEFLCEHHFHLCDVIPAPAIQMRNLILSAFPRNMRLPDPFTPNLKVDLLPEINNLPRGTPPPDALLPLPIRSAVDALLANRAPPAALSQLVAWLALPPEQRPVSGNYNVPLINALVLYLASTSTPGAPVLPSSPAMDLISRLVKELDPEGAYLLLNGIANQLRYPNSHTHYFSCVLLMLFAEAPPGAAGEAVQAQVTRVLLERLIVNRPHPWGLLITFIELIKNPRYNFWSHSFTRCAPDIERLFESVARSCMGPMAALPQQQAAAKAGEVEEVKG